jgi:hypothetical protein
MHRNTLAGWICCSALTLTNPVQSQSLFSEVTATAHLALNDPAWSSSFGDYDNDGRPDLLVTATEIADPAGQRLALWHNEGNGMFSDQTRSVDVDVTTKELGGGALFGPPSEVRRRVRSILEAAGPRGHVFNLGHGVLPDTPIDAVEAMVAAVQEWRV